MRMWQLATLGCVLLPALAHGAAALVTAHTAEGISYYWSGSKATVRIAIAEATKACNKDAKKAGHTGPCNLKLKAEGPRYWAIFHAPNGGIGFSAHADRQTAIDEAYGECRAIGECPDSAAHVWVDGSPAVAARPAPSTSCRPPAGQVVRYSDHCINGSCQRRYENGCTVSFQAAHCYNSFQNRWEWKPDGC